MTVTLRPAKAADAPAAAAAMTAWMAETPWFPVLHTAEEDAAFVARKIADAEVTLAEERRGVAGFMVLEEDYIACLYLQPWARGKGTGRALLEHAKAARPGGFTLWTFQANIGARRFYAREGLVARQFTDGADNAEKLPDVEFVWHPKAPE